MSSSSFWSGWSNKYNYYVLSLKIMFTHVGTQFRTKSILLQCVKHYFFTTVAHIAKHGLIKSKQAKGHGTYKKYSSDMFYFGFDANSCVCSIHLCVEWLLSSRKRSDRMTKQISLIIFLVL